ncbi:DCC1-like thiol-disulfide oxidoreductase family protein [Prochlorococcus sp. MIT 1307]|uniref:DCC1-like thiol-disulfide oxidoreductase family protein n=1 Tax=Prochlorococcus sp. MIT 1307 TaxID=3096219 RepID=UPI002A753750|nr:DCC1-like thiol-disulfide oxidoreductase family protein [Prochlorococcus sp. MIT 1307]
MESKFVFIYDGQCPFCNHFAELLELKSNLSNIQIKNARENPPELPVGYDMDQKGAILIRNNEILQGASAINTICSQIKDPSGPLLKILSTTFSSNQRTNLLFPLLLIARRVSLFIKGVPRKLVF